MNIFTITNISPPGGSAGLGGPTSGRVPTSSHHHLESLRRRRSLTWTLAAMAPVLAVGLVWANPDSASSAVLVAALVQLVAITVVAVAYIRRNGYALSGLGEILELGSRAEVAEAALSREQERMHQLRATIVGITMSQRVLHERRDELTEDMTARLEHLREAELGRLERLLADQPSEPGQPVELASVIDPLVVSLELRGHRVHWAGTRCCALGRGDDIAEIVQGLLENAVRHAAGQEIAVQVVPRGTWIDVRVSDAGPGVDPSVLPGLFERGTRSPQSPGEGLGLHVARRLTLEMGGQLALDRSAGTGATFVLTLPSMAGVSTCLAHSG